VIHSPPEVSVNRYFYQRRSGACDGRMQSIDNPCFLSSITNMKKITTTTFFAFTLIILLFTALVVPQAHAIETEVDATEVTAEACADTVDNDEDFLIDLSDPDCAPFAVIIVEEEEEENTAELCSDSVDNNNNFLIDLSDPDCAPFVPVDLELQENTSELCHDEIDNDDNFLVDASDPSCASFYVAETAHSDSSVSRSGGRRNNRESNVPNEGSVLGAFDDASLSCGSYITTYIKYGGQNNIGDVARLQMFLREFMNADILISGIYDLSTFEAVKALQVKYADQILKPWADAGLMDPIAPTGYVFKTTQWFINNTKCSSLGTPFPLLP